MAGHSTQAHRHAGTHGQEAGAGGAGRKGRRTSGSIAVTRTSRCATRTSMFWSCSANVLSYTDRHGRGRGRGRGRGHGQRRRVREQVIRDATCSVPHPPLLTAPTSQRLAQAGSSRHPPPKPPRVARSPRAGARAAVGHTLCLLPCLSLSRSSSFAPAMPPCWAGMMADRRVVMMHVDDRSLFSPLNCFSRKDFLYPHTPRKKKKPLHPTSRPASDQTWEQRDTHR